MQYSLVVRKLSISYNVDFVFLCFYFQVEHRRNCVDRACLGHVQFETIFNGRTEGAVSREARSFPFSIIAAFN